MVTYSLTKIPGSRVNNKVLVAINIFINLNKVVASSKSAYRTQHIILIKYFLASEFMIIRKNINKITTDVETRWNHVVYNSVERRHINVNLSKLNNQHSTPNIYPNSVRNYTVININNSSNRTTCSSMNIWHNSYSAFSVCFAVGKFINLKSCTLFNRFCIYFYMFHIADIKIIVNS